MCNGFKLEHYNVPSMRPLASNAGGEDSTLEMQSSKRHTASLRRHHRDMLAADGGHPTAGQQQLKSQCLSGRKRKKPTVELEAASITSQKVLKVNADDQRQRQGESYELYSRPGPLGKKRSRRKATQESTGSTAESQQAQLGHGGRGIGEGRGGGSGAHRCAAGHSPTHSTTHPLTHSLTRSLTRPSVRATSYPPSRSSRRRSRR